MGSPRQAQRPEGVRGGHRLRHQGAAEGSKSGGWRGLVVGPVPQGLQLPRRWPCCLLCGWLQTHPFLQVLISHHEERCSSLVSLPRGGNGSPAEKGPASLALLPSPLPARSRPHPGVSRFPPLPYSQRTYKTRLWAFPSPAMEGGLLKIPPCLGEVGACRSL